MCLLLSATACMTGKMSDRCVLFYDVISIEIMSGYQDYTIKMRLSWHNGDYFMTLWNYQIRIYSGLAWFYGTSHIVIMWLIIISRFNTGNADLQDSTGKQVGNTLTSNAMHWGPFFGQNGYSLTTADSSGDFADTFHTYSVEWNDNDMT